MRRNEKFWKIVFLSMFAFASTSWAGPENLVLRLDEMAMPTDHDTGIRFHLRCAVPTKYKKIPGADNVSIWELKAGETKVYNAVKGWKVTCGDAPKQGVVSVQATPPPVQAARVGLQSQQQIPQLECKDQIYSTMRAPIMINGRECIAHDFLGRALSLCTLYKGESIEEAKARFGITNDRPWPEPNRVWSKSTQSWTTTVTYPSRVMINGRVCVVHDFVGRSLSLCTLYEGETAEEAAARFGITDGRPWPKQPTAAQVTVKRACTGKVAELGRSPALAPAVAQDWAQVKAQAPAPQPQAQKRSRGEIDNDEFVRRQSQIGAP